MPPTVKSLEERIDDLEEKVSAVHADIRALAVDLGSFKSRTDTVTALIKWIGVFVAGLTVTTVFNIISVAHSAGKIESNVERLREVVQRQETTAEKQSAVIHDLEKQLIRLQAVREK
jgi:uncharacterized coiled-coil protein SlyX